MTYSVQQIAKAVGASAEGDIELMVSGVAEPASAKHGEMALAMDPRYASSLSDGAAEVAMLWEGADWRALGLKAAILPNRPRYALSGVTRMLDKGQGFKPGIHPTAVIDPEAVLGEGVSIPALVAIVVGMTGVLILSNMPEGQGAWWRRLDSRAAILGIGSGVFFAVSGVCYRGATLQIAVDDPLTRAVVTLAAVGISQLIGMGLWMHLRERGQIGKVVAAWRTAGLIGLASLGGSVCWFTAFTLQNATYVYAVGQSEVILSLLASYVIFRERLSWREGTGIALVSVSVLSLILLV